MLKNFDDFIGINKPFFDSTQTVFQGLRIWNIDVYFRKNGQPWIELGSKVQLSDFLKQTYAEDFRKLGFIPCKGFIVEKIVNMQAVYGDTGGDNVFVYLVQDGKHFCCNLKHLIV